MSTDVKINMLVKNVDAITVKVETLIVNVDRLEKQMSEGFNSIRDEFKAVNAKMDAGFAGLHVDIKDFKVSSAREGLDIRNSIRDSEVRLVEEIKNLEITNSAS